MRSVVAGLLACVAICGPAQAQTGTAWQSKITPLTFELPPGWSPGVAQAPNQERIEKPRTDTPGKVLAMCTISLPPPFSPDKPATQKEINMAFQFLELPEWRAFMSNNGVKNPSWLEPLEPRIIDGKIMIAAQAEEMINGVMVRHQLAMVVTPTKTYQLTCLTTGSTWPRDPNEPRETAFADLASLLSSMHAPG